MIIHDLDQRSEEWYAIKAGKPSASEFSSIVTSKGERSKSLEGYAITLATELFAGRSIDAWEGNQWSERGKELEEQARLDYAFTHGVEVHPVGFVTDDDQQYGCSPDSFVGADGLVEIKCLKAERHAGAILYFQKHGRCQPDYVQQTQGQMMVTGRAWCDLHFHHPILPPLTIRQYPIPEVQAALRLYIPEVIAERDRVLAALRKQAA